MNQSEFKLRYSRQISLPEIGLDGQIKLKDSKVLIIGCGALGAMVGMQLAGAGVGKIGIVDYDTVDISNLQRQFFFKEKDSGKSKVSLIKRSIKELNSGIEVEAYDFLFTYHSGRMFSEYDFIVDATDNPDSKRMIGQLSQEENKPCTIGGVMGFCGQVMTFLPEEPRFEAYFGNVDSQSFMPCSIGGVLGPTAALCASIQASEVIKYLTGSGKLLTGRVFIFNLLSDSFSVFEL